ncbi:MAG: M3 family metallopeptidase, partial [Alphaproteobacteria bacterium]|nr:M3 family metallopeptidase [Alphaproteobacteria bacterium]
MIASPDFSKYQNFDYIKGVNDTIALARARIAALKASGRADFSAIVELETCDEELSALLEIFYGLLGTDTTDEMQELAQKLGPISAAFSSEISQDEELFKLVDTLWNKRESLKLNKAQYATLEKHWKGFVRNGALLDAKGKARLKDIDAELSKLSPRYSDNYLKSTKAFSMLVTDKAELAGLPESAITAAHEEAEAKGHKDAWLFTLDYPSYGPFMTYADNRGLREKMWRAFGARAFGDAHDNCETTLQIVKLRHERANLLGYKTHADFVLERRMAETPARVMAFLERLKNVGMKKAKEELAELKAFAGVELKPWDIGYYSEKLKQKKYAFDSEQLRPYFPVQAVLQGCFQHCEKLFGLTFRESKNYPVYHPEVQTFEVVDTASGQALGLLYADFFPRGGKRSGAWQGTFRERRIMRDGTTGLPLSTIVCNFTKPTKDKPSLITFDEVETLFHEMGHALHTLLTEIDLPSVSGTSVYWDFVELPSQMMENWLSEKETLDLFAKHYQTGETIPQNLIDALKASQNFMAGWTLLRQVQLGTLDMAWHSTDPATITDVLKFERSVLEPLSLMPYEGGCISTSFGHLFSGGYSAGYYSYQWAEVL